jgi:RNA-splicing ligase RtcB
LRCSGVAWRHALEVEVRDDLLLEELGHARGVALAQRAVLAHDGEHVLGNALHQLVGRLLRQRLWRGQQTHDRQQQRGGRTPMDAVHLDLYRWLHV